MAKGLPTQGLNQDKGHNFSVGPSFCFGSQKCPGLFEEPTEKAYVFQNKYRWMAHLSIHYLQMIKDSPMLSLQINFRQDLLKQRWMDG